MLVHYYMQGFGSFKTLDVLLTCVGHSHYEVNLNYACFQVMKLIIVSLSQFHS